MAEQQGDTCAAWACSDAVVLCEIDGRRPLCRFHALIVSLGYGDLLDGPLPPEVTAWAAVFGMEET